MSDEAERARLGACAANSIKRFNVEEIAETWEEMLHQVVNEQKGRYIGQPLKGYRTEL